MKSTNWWKLVAIFLSLAVILWLPFRARRLASSHRIQARQIEDDLRANIRLGTSRKDIEAYLDCKGWQHSYIEKFDSSPQLSRTETALIRNTSRSWLTRADVQVTFKFDERQNLSDYSVQEIFTGP